MALVGAFEVGKVIEGSPDSIWNTWGLETGITAIDFKTYFAGRNVGFGLVVARAWKLPAPVKLAALRTRQTGFRPPQAYHYLPLTTLSRLGGVSFN
jgi:predicted transcriptional regulator